MKKSVLSLCLLAGASSATAADYDVEIQNITRGVYFTPVLVAAHPTSADLFEPGVAASSELQAMAEGGDISGLSTMVQNGSGEVLENPAGGLLAPGSTTSGTLTVNDSNNTQLSLVAMLLPTNDGFFGFDGIDLPTEPGTYTFYGKAYDAGTEANDEVRGSGTPGQAGMPVPPPLDPMLGDNGTGFSANAEGYVHIHRGVLGDTDSQGGLSDIDSTLHRWLNPVVRVTITVQ